MSDDSAPYIAYLILPLKCLDFQSFDTQNTNQMMLVHTNNFTKDIIERWQCPYIAYLILPLKCLDFQSFDTQNNNQMMLVRGHMIIRAQFEQSSLEQDEAKNNRFCMNDPLLRSR